MSVSNRYKDLDPEIKNNIVILMVIAMSFMYLVTHAQQADATVRYTKVPSGYLMVLHQGDSLMKELETLAIREQVPSASFTGQGFVNVRFGFFDAKAKQYKPKEFNKVELSGMTGTLAWQNGKPSVHAHGVAAGSDFVAHAGHILAASVDTGTLEILVVVHDKKLQRRKDEQLGANILRLP